MPPSIPVALLMLLLAGGWVLGRRRVRPCLRSTDATAVAELNRSQIERLRLPPASPDAIGEPTLALTPAPSGAMAGVSPEVEIVAAASAPASLWDGGRRSRLPQLQAWMLSSREQRLQALQIARQSSRDEALPLLRLGLRDPDPAVMAAAAAAMVRFRGRAAAGSQQRPSRPADPRRLRQFGRAAGSAPLSRPRSVLRTR